MKSAVIVSILMAISFSVNAGILTVTISLDPSDIRISAFNEWTIVEFPDAQQKGTPGAPLLPAISQVFVLPDGARNIVLSVNPIEETSIASSGLRIIPATTLRPLDATSFLSVRLPDPEIYSSTANWPEDIILSSHTGNLSGYNITSCLIQPWVYIPKEGSFSLINEIEIVVEWEDGPKRNLSPSQARIAQERVSAFEGIIHSADMELNLPPHGSDSYYSEYLLICDNAYIDIFEPLAYFHEQQGLCVEIAVIQEVLTTFPGVDDAEKLRNFIRDRYLNHGTVYVLLAGDESIIPVRMVSLYCEGHPDIKPVDLYFADLDGTWDESGDGEFGQPDDSLDLYADVLLGRALFSTPEEAEIFVQKNITYQNDPPSGDWQIRAVLCGAVLFEDIGYTADKGCDSIAVEFPSYWDVNKFYEELPGGGFTTHIPIISSGTAWNHYAGHGNERIIHWHRAPLGMMSTWIVSDSLFNGNKTGVHTSIACHPGDYVGYDCCAEALLNKSDGGGVAVLFNTSYGWEGHWPSLGASEWMCIDLARQVFRYQSSSLGAAFSTAKDLRIPFMDGGYDRTFQSVLSWTAFIDPALKVMRTEGGGPGPPPPPFSISPPWPNPATDDTSIAFTINFNQGDAQVSVHDIAGKLIWETHIASPQTVTWNTTDHTGRRLPTGVYVISARIGDYIVSRLTTILN